MRLLIPRKPFNFQNYEILQETFGGTVLSGENLTEASRTGKFLTKFVSELGFPLIPEPNGQGSFHITYVHLVPK